MTVAVMVGLRDTERERLRELEDRIERGLLSAVQTGRDLAEIRDRRLYRERGETFEEYAEQRFGITRRHAYRLIEAASFEAELSPTGHTPTSERVARELSPLRDAPEEMREAWTEAVEQHGPKPTAAQVRLIVRGPEEARDPRYMTIENAVALMQQLPRPEQIVWPIEAYDFDATSEAMNWMAANWPAISKSWREHKARLRAQGKAMKAAA